MKRTQKIALALAAGAVTGGALIAGPAVAAFDNGYFSGGTSQSRQWGPGGGMGGGIGGCYLSDISTVPSGTLTSAQKTALASMAEEEKLAHDLYTAFAGRYDSPVFNRVATAETQHLAAVRTLLSRYQLADLTAGKAQGKFATAPVQATYDRLLAQGKTSEQAALRVGQTVEKDDIAALKKALTGLDAPDVQRVYTQLLNASRMHQVAFERWIS
ncbi:DUF2202 domain-containing protein [Acrocarpospora sp. B8E8]|uniref:DUF2202 domain-containing protein n=1 Tax=Acrocarpospora sp. B8E8 TaxID=3153572 RepID=UPI00325CEC29